MLYNTQPNVFQVCTRLCAWRARRPAVEPVRRTHRWRERWRFPVSKLLPLADVGGGAKDGQVVIQLWSEMERGPHLVRCAGLLLLLAGVGAQKKLLEKVLKKTTTLKPRLLQTSDGKHCRSSPDVATRSLGLNVNDKSLNIQRANFMGIMSCSFTPNFVG